MAKARKPKPAAKVAKRKTQVAKHGIRALQPESVSDRIVWWSLHALVFAVPLAISNLTFLDWLVPTWNLPLTYDQFDIIKVFTMRAIILVAFGAWAWGRLTVGGRLRRTKLDWLILILLGWLLLTTVTSIHPATALFGKYRRFEGLLSFITYAAIFFVTVQAVDRPAKMRSLARTLVVSGFVVGLYGVAQYVGIDLIHWGKLPFEFNRAFATYGNPDLLGGYLMFPLPISLALGLSETDHRWRWFYWVAFSVLLLAWIVSFVRGAWIGGVVALGIVIAVGWRKRARLELPDKVVIGASGAAAVGVVIRSLSASSAVLNVVQRIASIFKFGEGSALTRFEIWDSAWRAAKARPITGFGADTFRLVFPKYKPIEYVADAGYLSVADNVHNYPLQMASAIGFPGVILLYAVFVRALWVSAKDALGRESGERLLLAGFWAAAAGYLTSLIFGLSVTGSTFLLWFSMAILLVPTSRVIEIPSSAAVWRTVVAALVVALVLVALFFNVRYVSADHLYLLSKAGALSSTETIESIERAIELNPYNDMYRAELGLAYMQLTLQRVQDAAAKQAAGEDPSESLRSAQAFFDEAEKAFLDVIEFVPPEYDNYVFLANLYNVGGAYLDARYFDDAVETANRGIEVEPFGPAIRVQAGRALTALDRNEEAIEMLAFAAEMDPDFADPRILLAQIHIGLEQYREAASRLAQALDIDPGGDDGIQLLRQMLTLAESGEQIGEPAEQVLVFSLAGEFLSRPDAYEIASAAAPEALEANPDDLMVLKRAATAFIETGRTSEAVDVLETMAPLTVDKAYPLNVWPYEKLSTLYGQLGDDQQAFDWYERGLGVDSWHAYSARTRNLDSLRARLEGQ